MSVPVLLNSYKSSPRLFQLADKLSFAQPQKIALKNLRGSSPQFILAAILQHEACATLNHLVI